MHVFKSAGDFRAQVDQWAGDSSVGWLRRNMNVASGPSPTLIIQLYGGCLLHCYFGIEWYVIYFVPSHVCVFTIIIIIFLAFWHYNRLRLAVPPSTPTLPQTSQPPALPTSRPPPSPPVLAQASTMCDEGLPDGIDPVRNHRSPFLPALPPPSPPNY